MFYLITSHIKLAFVTVMDYAIHAYYWLADLFDYIKPLLIGLLVFGIYYGLGFLLLIAYGYQY